MQHGRQSSSIRSPAKLQTVPLPIILLAAAVGFAPLAFGATEAWSLAVTQALVGVAAIGWLVGRLACLRWVWIAAAVAILAWWQVWPMPEGLLAHLSPVARQRWVEARDTTGLLCSSRLSLAPDKTLAGARQAFLLTLVVAMLADVARHGRAARWLACSVAGVGLMVLLLGLATWPLRGKPLLGFHDMRGPLKSYKSPLLDPKHSAGFGYAEQVAVGRVSYTVFLWNVGDTFGPFVVSNHYAGCLELTIPLAAALVGCGANGRAGRWQRTVRRLLLGLIVLLAFATVALGAKSWAGTAGLVLGLAWVAWQASAGRWRRRAGVTFALAGAAWITAFVLSLRWDVAAAVAQAGLAEPAQTLADSLQKSVRGRWEMWRLCARMWADTPWTGLGLGAFADAYPHYVAGRAGPAAANPSLRPIAFAHADYLQLAAETGTAGLVLAAVFVVLAIRQVRQNWKAMLAGPHRPVPIGLGASLVAFLPHGLFDWNLHVPANALLLAVVVGTLLGTSGAKPEEARPTGRLRKGLRHGVAVVLIAALGLCLWAAIRDVVAERAVAPLRLALLTHRIAKVPLPEKQAALEAALASGLWAAEVCPHRAEYAELIGRAYLDLSNGHESGDLAAAERWFSRALVHAPLRQDLADTVGQLRGKKWTIP